MQADVVVIGAGIHGVGVAQAVVAAGYSVIVLEKNFPASGTSSKSSKLIHGGLRYLESGQIKLVRECLYERHLLLKNAPELVQLKPFYLPVYRDTSRPAWKIRMGLSLYYALAGFRSAGRFTSLPRSQWQSLDGLKTDNLINVFQYFDAQTNDTELTKAVMQSAQSLGAEFLYPARLIGAERRGKLWEVSYQQDNQTGNIQTKVIVNASGPWANQVLDTINPQIKQTSIELVQGTHIIVPEQVTQGIYYLEAPRDKRAVFVIPWGDKETMIGTTEKVYTGNPDDVVATEDEIAYLLETASFYFPKFARYSKNNLSKSFAGLRVLPAGGDTPFAKARDTIIHEDLVNFPGLYTLYGGKLTAYRATAEQLLNRIKSDLPNRTARADTRQLPLTPAAF